MSRAAQGLRAWLMQRITAIYLAIYLVSVLAYLALQSGLDYQAWHSWLASPAMGVLTALFMLALVLHVWVGVRDVLIDYIHAVGLRLLFMVVCGLVLLGSLLWVFRALALAALQGSA